MNDASRRRSVRMSSAPASSRLLLSSLAVGGLALACGSCAWILGYQDGVAQGASGDASPAEGATGGDGACGDTTSDASNCGACGVQCATGLACHRGACGDIVQVATGQYVDCVVTWLGQVYCWGNNSSAELGSLPPDPDASAGPPCRHGACSPTPALIGGLGTVVGVSLGEESACALDDKGAVSCWGGDYAQVLGYTMPIVSCPFTPCQPTPQQVVFPAGTTIAEIVNGAQADCARSTSGDVYCWGSNEGGLLGVSQATQTSSATPVHVTSNVAALDVSQFFHACAVLIDGSVSCWGFNDEGKLGHAPTQPPDTTCPPNNDLCNPTPTPLSDTNVTHAADVRTGGGFSCALGQDQTVRCWGTNQQDALGNAMAKSTFSGVVPTSLPAVKALTAGGSQVFAWTPSGSVLAWGEGGSGTLGLPLPTTLCNDGHSFCAVQPTPVPSLQGAVQISARWGAGLALMRDGRVLAWGVNDDAQLGHMPGDGGDVTTCDPVGNPAVTPHCNPTPQPVAGLQLQ